MCLLGTDSDCGLLRHPDPLVRVVKIYSLLAPYLCVLTFQSCPLSFCHLLIKQPVFCLNLGAFFIWVFWELCVWVLGTCSFANLGAINTCHSYSPASAFPSGASTPRYDHSLSIHINLNIFIINLFFFSWMGLISLGFWSQQNVSWLLINRQWWPLASVEQIHSNKQYFLRCTYVTKARIQ